jgi:poly-gamma-glutamate synthesis protein (capsule biosynthesis protein)
VEAVRLLLLLLVLLAGCHRETAGARTVLWFGGDVHLGEDGARALEGLALDGPLVVNLEGPVTSPVRPSSAASLSNPPETARALASAQVIAVGVENNHALDDGPDGLARTQATLRAAGLTPLGFTTHPVSMLQVDLSRGLPDGLDALLALRRPVVVLFHVLAPPTYLPDPHVRGATAKALAAGARAVLVHGSHAIGPVERREAAVVAWGLGNLAFDCDCTMEDEGLLVRLELDGQAVTRATVVPVRAGLRGARARLPEDATLDLELLESLGSTLSNKTKQRADW